MKDRHDQSSPFSDFPSAFWYITYFPWPSVSPGPLSPLLSFTCATFSLLVGHCSSQTCHYFSSTVYFSQLYLGHTYEFFVLSLESVFYGNFAASHPSTQTIIRLCILRSHYDLYAFILEPATVCHYLYHYLVDICHFIRM